MMIMMMFIMMTMINMIMMMMKHFSQDNEGVWDVVPPGLLHMLGRKK